jgi:hypothetical protein
MATQIAVFFITLLINIATGIAIFFFMLLAMNGFNESDAAYGLGAYIVLAVAVGLAVSAGAAFTAHLLRKRGFRSVVAVLCAVPLFSGVGVVVNIVCSIIGVLISEFVRVNY